MAIVIDTQAVADADAYFSTRLGAEPWIAATLEKRTAALTTAAMVLNAMEWAGYPSTSSAAFPRYLPGTSSPVTPLTILWALYEQALHLLINPGVLGEEESVDSLVLGPLQLKEIRSVSLIPKLVQRYIGPYTVSNGSLAGGGTWWRAN